MTEIENNIGYKFKNVQYLENALTHSSYANENRRSSNERLEFLGDAVLSIIISDYIFNRMSNTNEGDLSKLRASLVCEQSLYKVAKRVSLEKFILLGKGEEQTGGRERPSIVSDAFEAVLAAIYLDGGIEKARAWVLKLMKGDVEDAIKGKCIHDYKTALQEKVQRKKGAKVEYELVKEVGEDHNKTFTIQVKVKGKAVGTGEGRNKKEAAQNAAKAALKKSGWYEKL
ncbi:MAG: ribonuclease III [Clostridiales bacterium]|nr:ribonuclease III [Clostridiales bacterium]